MTDPLETPEGQRIATAVAEALSEHSTPWNAGLDGWRCSCGHKYATQIAALLHQADAALRAALSVTGECKTCGGTRRVRKSRALVYEDGNPHKAFVRSVDAPCPDCIDGGEPLLVLRDPDEPHILTVNDTGWYLKHPFACRPHLDECAVHHAVRAMEDDSGLPGNFWGKRVVALDTNGVLREQEMP